MHKPTTSILTALALAAGTLPALASPLPTTEPGKVSEPLARYWNDSLSGGPGKDGIPSIDAPRFEPPAQAARWLDDGDPVIGLQVDGQARAYPQSIMVWHEIVNDTFAGRNVAVTYCPLTGTALGFDRGDDELGVSGRLVNSNLIMYNRASDSYWPQILAAAVHGPEAGAGLEEVRVIWTNWGNWRERHPETEVLSRRTGHARNYRRDPYGSYNPRSGYYAEGGTLFPLFATSDRHADKHEIFGFRTAAGAWAVEAKALAEAGHLRHEDANGRFLILHDPGLDTAWIHDFSDAAWPDPSAIEAIDFTRQGPRGAALEGRESVNGFEAMWFAWYAFYPETVVIDGR